MDWTQVGLSSNPITGRKLDNAKKKVSLLQNVTSATAAFKRTVVGKARKSKLPTPEIPAVIEKTPVANSSYPSDIADKMSTGQHRKARAVHSTEESSGPEYLGLPPTNLQQQVLDQANKSWGDNAGLDTLNQKKSSKDSGIVGGVVGM